MVNHNTDKKKAKEGETKTTEEVQSESRIKELEQALSEAEDTRLRAIADFKNLQRRTEEEKLRLTFFSNATLLTNFIDIIDDLDRAMDHLGKQDDSIVSGFTAIKTKMQKVIDSMNVREIETNIDDEYDSQIHEAIGTVQVGEDKKKDLIIQIVQKGYKISDGEEDFILRPVRVIVGK